MSHSRSTARKRIGALFTSLATAFALIVPLAGPAFAAPGDGNDDVASLEVTAGDGDHNPADGVTTHTFTVSATDSGGTAVNEATISAEIISGPNADYDNNGNVRDFSCDTGIDDSGDCDIPDAGDDPYTSTDSGTDTVRFWVDTNGNNAFDSGEVSTQAEKHWFGDPASVTIEPTADSAAVGTCNDFTVTVEDAEGNPVVGQEVRIIRNHDETDRATEDVDNELRFCTPSTDGNDVSTTEGDGTTGEGDDEGETDTGTDENGQLTFGVESDLVGDETVRAYVDLDADGDFDNTEPTATATKTWSEGGADAVETLTVDPQEDTNFVGETHTHTVTVVNANGDPVPGVTVQAEITSGPNAPDSTTAVTDNDGQATIPHFSSTEGTDVVLFWVNQSGGTSAADDGEPQDTAEKTWIAGPEQANLTLTCDDTNGLAAGAQDPEEGTQCDDPTDHDNEVFTATVLDDADDPVEGAVVEFTATVNSGNADDISFADGEGTGNSATVRCTTGADGTCSVTLLNANPEDADSVTVTADVLGTTDDTPQTVDKVWHDREAAALSLSPARDVNEIGATHTVVATVDDQFGDPIEGTEVDFQVTGRNPSGTSGFDQTTDASGQASFEYEDEGPATPGDDTITAWADLNGDDDPTGEPTDTATKHWVEDAEADEVAVDMQPVTSDPETFDPATSDTDCNGDLNDFEDTDEVDGDDWEETATNTAGDRHVICASAKSTGGASDQVLFGHTVTFTSSGVGHFEDLDGNDVGSSHEAMIDENGYAYVVLHSTESGDQDVTATVDDSSDTGTKTWEPGNARNIDLAPNVAINAPGDIHQVTATVTDRFGNAVPGVDVDFTEEGTGRFVDGTSTASGTTNASGQVTVEVTTQESEDGRQFITGAIDDATTDCELAADDPDEGDPAGNCSDTAEKVWGADIEALEPLNQTVTAGEPVCLPIQVLDTDGDPIEGAEVVAELTGANEDEPITGQTGPCDDGASQQSTGEAITDADGIASFVYTPQNAGTDTITIWADFDDDGVLDDGEPSVVYTLTVQEDEQPPPGEDEVIRFPGDDRMHTAILTSQDRFPDEHSADAVVLARSDDFPDALAGTPLAVGTNAPLLLTPSPENWAARGQTDHIHPDTLAEIDRVLADGGPVIILGREMAIGTATQDDLDDRWNVVRLGGIDRFETAVEIADAIDTSPDTVFVTTGRKFPDALSAGAAAADVGAVIVLADEDANGTGQRNTQFTDPYLAQHATATLWAIGGPAATAYPEADNSIRGESRLGTAVMVAQTFFPSPTDVGIARADNFPDALSGGVHIGHIGGPLVLTQSQDLNAGWGSLNSDAGLLRQYLEQRADTIGTAYIYGGTAAIAGTVDAQVENAIS